MIFSPFTKLLLSTALALAFVAGCGPAAQTPVVLQQSTGSRGAARSPRGYLYVYEYGNAQIDVLTFPDGKPVRSFHNVGWLCTDPNSGNLYVADGATLYEYSPGGATLIGAGYYAGNYSFMACSVDPGTGDVAVMGFEPGADSNPNEGVVAVYSSLYSYPSIYFESQSTGFNFGGYDNESNLFVSGVASGSAQPLWELPKGASTFMPITLNPVVYGSGIVQWDGSDITMENPYRNPKIYRIAVSGSSGTVVGKLRLGYRIGREPQYSWIDGNIIVAPWGSSGKNAEIGFWKYPRGGKKPYKVLTGFHYAYSLATGPLGK